MRRRLLKMSIIAALLSLPVWVGAQDAEPVPESAGVGDAEAVPEAQEGDQIEVGKNAPTEYVVQEGDTLWDLCRRFLNNPWYWPKVWSYNPEIENPHWIYPGNKVRFYPGAGALPSEMEAVAPTQIEDTDIGGDEDYDAPQQVTEEDLFEAPADLPQRLAAARAKKRINPLRRSFVTPEELEHAGVIEGSMEDMQLLTIFQRVYLKLKSGAQPGQNYEIFRVDRPIRHPVTGADLGYVIKILGSASIESADGQRGIAMIETAFFPIERGDRLAPFDAQHKRLVDEVPNEKKLKGYVVDTDMEGATMTGEYLDVFVDLGKDDGIKVGNTLLVVRSGDGFTGQVEDMPDEVIGKLTILDVRDQVSTAVVTKSNRELFPGDRVEMRVSQ